MKNKSSIYEKSNRLARPYNKWLLDNNLQDEYVMQHHNDYWDKELEPLYDKSYFEWLNEINCVEYHKLLFSDSEFFEKILDYMKSINWYWGNKKIPTINNLKNCVLELSYNSNGSEIQSGGFHVTFCPNKFLIVQFEKFSSEFNCKKDDILFEKIITVKDMRERKLKKLIYG